MFLHRLRAPGGKALLFLGLILLLSCDFVTSRPSSLIQPTALPSVVIPTSPIPLSPTATLFPSATPTLTLFPTSLPPTLTPTPDFIRFAVIGDYGLGGQEEKDVADLVKSWKPDFIITTGDNNYPDGAAETIDDHVGQFYHEYIYPYMGKYGQGADKNRFFPTLGNHDWNTAGAQAHFEYFTLPGNERYYDFVWGPVHFFALDSDSREPDGVGASTTQAQWLQNALAASTSPWKIVYMHQPPYSSGLHGSIDWIQWPFGNWGATIALGGHDHVYERLEIDGFSYIVNGLGGGPRYYFVNPLPGSLIRYNDDNGAMLVVADSQQITFQFITRQGELIDEYRIQR